MPADLPLDLEWVLPVPLPAAPLPDPRLVTPEEATSRFTAFPTEPWLASCAAVPGGSVPPPWCPPPDVVEWPQLAPGTVSTYWLTPALPGGAQLAANEPAGNATSAAMHAVKSNRSFMAMDLVSCMAFTQ
jgi:hypothetical protein